MEKALLHFLGGRRKTDVSALELRLIPAADLLQAQREAETLADNRASQRVLEKLGFRPNGKVGEEGPRWSLDRASFDAACRA